MTFNDAIQVSIGVSVLTSAIYAAIHRLFVKPLRDEFESYKSHTSTRILELGTELEANKLADQKMREKFIEMRAKHDSQAENMNKMIGDISSKIDKLFDLIQAKDVKVSDLSQKVAVLESR